VLRGVVNTAARGMAGTYSQIVSNKVLLCDAPEKPSIFAPSAGYILPGRAASEPRGSYTG